MTSDVAVILTTLLLLLLPGLAVAGSLGLRPATALGAAPVLTFGLIATAATVATFVSFPWNPATFLLGTALVCAVIVAVRLAWRRRRPTDVPAFPYRGRPARNDWVIAAGVVVGWATSAIVLLRAFGRLDNVNQDWDYVFHSNAVRLIADTSDVDPAALRAINDWEVQSSFYPNAFSALGALVRDVTGAPVFAVLNAQTMMIAGIAGLGLAILLRAIGAPTVVSAATPVLLAGFTSFPYDVIWRGPVLPFATGIALIPAFFLLLREALTDRRPTTALAAGAAAAALLAVQTATALSAALVVVPFLVQRWVPRGRTVVRDLVSLVSVGVSAVVLGLPFVSGALGVSSSGARVDWPAVEGVGQAIGDILTLNHGAASPQYWLAGLLGVGLLALPQARYMWWWIAGGAIAVTLFVISAAFDSTVVEDLTSPWWNDRWRFAALAVLALAPLAASGLLVIARGADRALSSALPRVRRAAMRPSLLALVLLVAVVLLSNGLYTRANEVRTAPAYQGPGQLSAVEVEAMRWLADQPDAEDGWVMNDPNDGSPYMQALFGLTPAFAHILPPGMAAGRTQRMLLEHFHCLDSSPEIRDAVEELDIRYVFVARGYVRADMTRTPGLTGLLQVDSLERVYQRPGVTIFRVALTDEPTEQDRECELSRNDNP
ncbi:DUF6541 family protein [Blastococcus sp. TF02A-26]|uniref:DUF6541 family protein n=1 Tax=Blastococcus sp. TF02A-26 TaxID=2250577 RepID=UPI000DE91654|nr:DUF6541 family protein [Blastococcus sp. TF02A-26]RBY89841.1 hypothetical protein DQ240_02710 [Blastococcus sp. TF02A-26]